MNQDIFKSDTVNMDFLPAGLKRTSRAEDILEVIKEGIIRGYWKPDDRINDQELSERLGVSRLTVREALSKLVERRLVEKRHWKGYTVRKLSWEEIDGLIDVRLALEELALSELSRRMTPEMMAELEASVEASRRVVESGDYSEFFKTDYQFHEILYRISGNPWLPDILNDLHLLISIVRFISQSEHVEDVARRSMAEHRRILEDLQNKDWDAAVRSLRTHLNNHRERVRAEYEIRKMNEEGSGTGGR